MLTVEIDEAEFEAAWGRVVSEIRVGAVRGAGLAAKEAADHARRNHEWKNRTGDTERGIGHETVGWIGDTYEARFFSRARHSSYLEEGTPPHLIPGNPFLAFEWRGERVFFRYVNHPGTRPMPFMGPALQKAERVIIREGELAVARAQAVLDR